MWQMPSGRFLATLEEWRHRSRQIKRGCGSTKDRQLRRVDRLATSTKTGRSQGSTPPGKVPFNLQRANPSRNQTKEAANCSLLCLQSF